MLRLHVHVAAPPPGPARKLPAPHGRGGRWQPGRLYSFSRRAGPASRTPHPSSPFMHVPLTTFPRESNSAPPFPLNARPSDHFPPWPVLITHQGFECLGRKPGFARPALLTIYRWSKAVSGQKQCPTFDRRLKQCFGRKPGPANRTQSAHAPPSRAVARPVGR